MSHVPMPADEQSYDDSKEPKAVRINRLVPSDMRSVFANHFVVRNSPAGEFVLLFFELDHPIRLGESGEKEIEEVDAHCIARIAVTKQTMGEIISAMAQNFSKSVAREAGEDPGENSAIKDSANADRKHVG